jgi:Flp pilus assembly protein TadD
MKFNLAAAGCLLALLWVASPAGRAQAGAADASDRYAAEGQQALAAGRYGEARTDFEQLAKLNPGVAEVHATLAAIYYQQREFELAEREVRTAQKLKPSLPKLDSLLGLSLAEMGRFAEALPRLEKGRCCRRRSSSGRRRHAPARERP